MTRTAIIGIALWVGSAAFAHADETLTLDLQPVRPPAVTVTNEPPARSSSSSTNVRTQPAGSSRGELANRHSSRRQEEKVVGQLGMTTEAAVIRRGRSEDSAALAKVDQGTYLALTATSGEWLGILMSDTTTGWIPARSVQMLNYEVVGSQTPSGSQAAPSLDDPLLNGGQRALLQTAYQYLGVKYVWGGTSDTGLDCSGFVQKVFRAMGINLPRTAAEQFTCGMPVSMEQLAGGDRLYFQSDTGRINHTGIYIGNGYFIHASGSANKVVVSRLDEGKYTRIYAGARR